MKFLFQMAGLECHIGRMTDQIASGIVVVRVFMTDHLVGGQPAVQLWAAAVPRDEAVAAVKRAIPTHWTAELTDRRLTQDHVRRLNMKLGSVFELSLAE
ncbi:hypothetical protein LRP31_02210 [Mesorhizobium mediterraneum]|nr:hypothetical protein [Mesorhizobium mediterraneum]RWN42070.1 MAG: hypothetical protein EOR96_10800 [Mesorhizobium sp.]WIW54091.1 hypothetical protein LRP31_02210 [Mesorhizobium mediterraneum]